MYVLKMAACCVENDAQLGVLRMMKCEPKRCNGRAHDQVVNGPEHPRTRKCAYAFGVTYICIREYNYAQLNALRDMHIAQCTQPRELPPATRRQLQPAASCRFGATTRRSHQTLASHTNFL
jgi:hypothetical protein